MDNFNFKSQIATDRNQSERLLALGLKKETADMTIVGVFIGTNEDGTLAFEDVPNAHPPMLKKDIPAWSLDRLRELIPENIFTGVRNQWHRVMYNGVLTYEEGDYSLVSFRGANIYDRCISCIEWLIKEGYFNKEYYESR